MIADKEAKNMQHVVVTIEDHSIEQAMSDIAQHEGVNLQDVIMQAICAFIRQQSDSARQFDPIRSSTPIHYVVPEDLTDVKPYASVTNSARFGERQNILAYKKSL